MIIDQEIDKRLLILKVIWFAMLMSLVINLFVGLYAAANVGPLMKEDVFGMVRPFFYVVSFIIFLAIRYIRKLFLAGSGQYSQSSQTPQPPTFQGYMIATIVTLAMSEGIGILGLVLFFLGNNHMDLYLLAVMSAVAMFLYRPRRDAVIIWSRESQEDLSGGRSNT